MHVPRLVGCNFFSQHHTCLCSKQSLIHTPYITRGSSELHTPTFFSNLLNKCVRTISKGLKIHDRDIISKIKADCDAFSILIIFDPDASCSAKESIQDILYHFGTKWSVVSLPHTPAATKTRNTKTKDLLFGSEHVKSCHRSCASIGSNLYESEILVINTPVKIAVHESCRNKIKHALDRRGFPIDVSSRDGLCFHPQSSSNMPPYETIVEILTSPRCSVVDELNKHIIHIGNVGTRYPIKTSVDSPAQACWFQKLFQLMHIARGYTGVVIDVCQIDVAFSVPNHGDKLVQWTTSVGGDQGNTMKKNSIFTNSIKEVWPLHDIVPSVTDKAIYARDQIGTVRVKHADWSKYSKMDILGMVDHPESLQETDIPDEVADTLESIYKMQSNNGTGVKCLSMDKKSIYSAKAYSDISHHTARTKHLFPITKQASNNLGDLNLVALQRLMHRLGTTLKGALHYVMDHGVRGRLELSIRPNGTNDAGNALRTKGNYVDIMSHVYVAIYDLFHGHHQLQLLLTTSYEVVSLRCNEIIRSVQQHISFRAQKVFKDIYSESVQSWLAAMVFLITTLLGLTHFGKIQPLLDWINNSPCYDPLSLKPKLLQGHFLHGQPNGNDTTPVHSNKDRVIHCIVDELQQLKITDQGIRVLIDLTDPDSSLRKLHPRLCLNDILILAENINDIIIPNVAKLLQCTPDQMTEKSMNGNEMEPENILDDSEVQFEDDEDDGGPEYNWHPHMHMNYIDPEVSLLNRQLSMKMLHQNQSLRTIQDIFRRPNLSTYDPVLSALVRLCDLSHLYDMNSPLFFKQLYKYIYLLYQEFSSILQHPTSDDLKIFLETKGNTYADLIQIFRFLGIDPISPKTRNRMVAQLCTTYWFPCLSCNYSQLEVSANFREKMTHLINKSLLELPCKELSTSEKTSRFYRQFDNLHIDILKPTSVMTEGKPDIEVAEGDFHNIFDAISSRFNPIRYDRGNGIVRQFMHDALSRLPSVSDTFLSPDAQNNRDFLDSFTLEELQKEKHFTLLHDQEQPHEIIFPATCLLYQTNILLMDCSMNLTYFHLYDWAHKKVISYKYVGTRWIPLINCVVFAMVVDVNGHSIYKSGKHRSDYSESSEAGSLMFSELSRLQIYQFPSKHPHGKAHDSKRNLQKCIADLLTSDNVKHRHFILMKQEGCNQDPLDIFPFLEELSLTDTALQLMFANPILDHFNSLFITDNTSLLNHLKDENHYTHGNFHTVLIPILCLRHKLWISIWEQNAESRNMKKSYFYWFDPHLQKVCRKIFDHFVFHPDHRQFMYIRINIKPSSERLVSCGFWNMPKDNLYNTNIPSLIPFNYHTLLSCEFSYLDIAIAKQLIHHMKGHLYMDITMDIEDEERKTPLVATESPKILPVELRDESKKLLQHTIIVVFSSDHSDTSPPYHEVYFLHRGFADNESLSEYASDKLALLFSDHVNDKYHLHILDTSKIYEDRYFSSSFEQILNIYMAHNSKSPMFFSHMIQETARLVADLTLRTKQWIKDCVLDPNCLSHENLPTWLKQILIN